ncbi:MAG TPA: glycosyltransferase [bacterium]|nr:glycosyltransferase [bacterium]HOL48420.1 glycosyltransferase [bacterium]HPQ19457.1 glycosyltransferase [bacterium]
MNASLIIPIYNAEKTLKLCFDSLLEQNDLPAQIIIVYCTSSDKSLEIILNYKDKLKFDIYEIPLSSPARARNTGIKFANFDLIFFIDSDCIVPKDYFKKLHQEIINKQIKVAGCKIYGFNPVKIIEIYLSEFGLALQDNDTIFTELKLFNSFLHTASFVINKNIIENIGYFNENLFTGEDHDFCYRILSKNIPIHFFNSIFIFHKFNNNFLKFIKQTFSFAKIHSFLIKKFKGNFTILNLHKKTFYIKSGIPFLINLNNPFLKFCFLILLLLFSKWFIILFLLWFLKLYLSLTRKFWKYKQNYFKIFILLIIHLIYNATSFAGDFYGIFIYKKFLK